MRRILSSIAVSAVVGAAVTGVLVHYRNQSANRETRALMHRVDELGFRQAQTMALLPSMYARVTSMKALIGQPDPKAPGEKIDIITLEIRNAGVMPYVAVSLMPYKRHQLYATGMYLSVLSVSGHPTHAPKPDDKWLFWLKQKTSERVIFVASNVGEDSYCAGQGLDMPLIRCAP